MCENSFPDNLKIYFFSWNTESVRFSGENDTSLLYTTTTEKISEKLPEKFLLHGVDLVCIALQEDAKPGSYLLPSITKKMTTLGYNLLKRSRMMGVGVSTWKSIQNFDIKLRGLRLALYVSNHFLEKYDMSENDIKVEEKYHCCSGIYYVTMGKGALSFEVSLPKFGKFNIVNAHLPFTSQSIMDTELRKEEVRKQNRELNLLFDNLSIDVPTFLLGDLNYRVHIENNEKASEIFEKIKKDCGSIFSQRDELKRSMIDQNVPIFYEGIENRGCEFMPTAKLVRFTKEEVFNLGKHDRRVPSWCDRILFFQNNSEKIKAECSSYQRWKRHKSMENSDHAAVDAVYTLTKVKKAKK